MKGKKWASFILTIAAGMAVTFTAYSQDAAFQRAFTLYRAGSLPEAKKILTAALKQNPSALDLSLMGTIETQQGDLIDAENHFRKALILEPGLQGARLTLATVLEGEGKAAAAQEVLESMVAAGNKNPQTFLALAQLENRRGNTEGALVSALKAKAVASNDPAVLYAVGALCLQMDLIKDGTENLEKAAALDPRPAVLYTLGSARVANRDLVAAKKIYENLLREDPKDPQVNYALGATCFLAGETDSAKPYFERSLTLQPDQVESLYYLGVIADQDGDKDKAAGLLRSVVERQPKHSRAHLALGQVYRSQGKLEEARLEFEEAIHLSPNSQKAHYQLGLLLSALKRETEAKKEFDVANELRASSDDKISWRLVPHQ